MTGTIRLILVDDHPVVRDGLRMMLQTAPDIEVIAEACDGFEAIEKANQLKPNVVLMDLHMPRMDGLEATRRLKTQVPSTTVIVLTVYDSDSYIIEAVKAGAGGYLLKDASKDLIVHTVRAVNSGGMLIKSSLLKEAVLSLGGAKTNGQKRGRTEAHSQMDDLTPRERDVLRLVAAGQSNKEIGEALMISEDTAKKHVQAIMLKLNVSDRTQAAVKAVRAGLQAEFDIEKI